MFLSVFAFSASASPQSYNFKISNTAQYGILDHKNGTAATIVSRSNNGWSCFEKWTISQRDLSYLWYSKSGPYYTFQPGYKYNFTMELLCLRSYAAISNGTLTLKAGSTVIGKYVPVIEDSSSGYRIMRYDVELTVSSSMSWDSFIFDFTCIPTGTIEFAVTDNVYITVLDPDQAIVDGIGDKIDDQTEQQKGFFQGLLDGILNGIKSFFIPSGDFFTQYFDDWNTWMSDHFGILYYPLDLFIDLCNRLLHLSVPDDPTITFPALQVGDTTLLAAQTYTFDFSGLPSVDNLHNIYLTVVDVIVVIWLVNLAKNKLNEIMSGG